jgi:hypothetical protein
MPIHPINAHKQELVTLTVTRQEMTDILYAMCEHVRVYNKGNYTDDQRDRIKVIRDSVKAAARS